MKKIQEAAFMAKIGAKHFDAEMREKGIKVTKESRIQYKAEQAAWLKSIVFANLREVFIRRWFDSVNGNSYYSLRLVAPVDRTYYVMHINMQYGYGDAYSLLRQSGISPDNRIVREWLDYNGIVVVAVRQICSSQHYSHPTWPSIT